MQIIPNYKNMRFSGFLNHQKLCSDAIERAEGNVSFQIHTLNRKEIQRDLNCFKNIDHRTKTLAIMEARVARRKAPGWESLAWTATRTADASPQTAYYSLTSCTAPLPDARPALVPPSPSSPLATSRLHLPCCHCETASTR